MSEIYELGKVEGASFYSDPESVDLALVDPLMRAFVQRMNSSGWVWTAECCQGHPDAPDNAYIWAGNTSPMVRLVLRTRRQSPSAISACRYLMPSRSESHWHGTPWQR